MKVGIGIEDPSQQEIIKLLNDGEEYGANLYPAESNHFLPIDELRRANTRFYVARNPDGRAVGTGAVVLRGQQAEIKRMWVVPEARGQGIAEAILSTIEECARAHGTKVIQLETGVNSYAAIRLYERNGYLPCGPFAHYRPDPLSVFMEKSLNEA